MNNITFDLETLGNTPNAPIVQIGAVEFTDDGEIKDEFLRRVELDSLQRFDFEVDYETLSWWLNQDQEAIESVFDEEKERYPLPQCLWEFGEWIGKFNNYYYWSHATFDPPILRNNFRLAGLNYHIPFRKQRDIRTLTHFTGKIEVEREGVHHDALDDARFQAKYISKGLQALNKFKETKMKYIDE